MNTPDKGYGAISSSALLWGHNYCRSKSCDTLCPVADKSCLCRGVSYSEGYSGATLTHQHARRRLSWAAFIHVSQMLDTSCYYELCIWAVSLHIVALQAFCEAQRGRAACHKQLPLLWQTLWSAWLWLIHLGLNFTLHLLCRLVSTRAPCK